MPGARTLAECKAACKSAAASGLPFCEGVLWKRREGKCYRKTRIIVGLCQFDTAFDLHLRSDLPPPPPPPPDTIPKSVPRSGPLTVANSHAVLHSRMPWIPAWESRFRLSSCLPQSPAGRAAFFDEPFTVEGRSKVCDKNWCLACAGSDGRPEARPLKGPLLLGYDTTILEQCMLAKSRSFGPDFMPLSYLGNNRVGPDIVDTCIGTGFNFLRVRMEWDYCLQAQYITCAMQGELPGQPQRTSAAGTLMGEIQFSFPPRELRLEHLWEDPAFTEANVFIHEVSMLAVLCKNGREIFEKGVGESFWCELDPTAYAEFARYPH